MKYFTGIIVLTSTLGCEQTFNLTQPSSVPPNVSVNSTNTNTNTNTNNIDRTGSDTGSGNTPNDPNFTNSVIPLPTYGESVTRSVASSNPDLLRNSCQTTSGDSAWAFLDLVIKTLQQQDARWGYLCKDSSCNTQARDIVAYRASQGNTGIWIVDVIGNHCPLPGDTVEVRWGVLPFETSRPWIGIRR